jgi:hypothetical protein
MDNANYTIFCGQFQSHDGNWVAGFSFESLAISPNACSMGDTWNCCQKNYNAWANRPDTSEADGMAFQLLD